MGMFKRKRFNRRDTYTFDVDYDSSSSKTLDEPKQPVQNLKIEFVNGELDRVTFDPTNSNELMKWKILKMVADKVLALQDEYDQKQKED